ncbi:MAG: winged helix-turn-helix transcriptional regulator [Betaproteobacteria bacterium]|jgi:DNA-binding transcriptional ArsR family regulator|uniref:Regulatory protein, ArsR n=1 Tax=Thiomonas delicata TaxID=364030 RepID=A0A238D1C6_THIDL|nr:MULTISPECIES: metalloregulator ArsR/SmtB family transcription factor [Thiomonas]MDE2128515.1 winged helix-turn-helix transcriptional regulator [Betaproteobacteria bacterium]OZB43873.1 MAG: ArsR family transcriptional regulator [Thiomonas sp. 15-66-11]OZB54393.1 MAG: ArsR family transcriptional regulator [Thiomonas sp. 14-66-4]OZB59533.1 MAG: ArsR family transcriptional regulator [Thiomonas sp. 13-66-29]SBP87045.1 Regulatory protein, ArsR [Thiomonas delicata]
METAVTSAGHVLDLSSPGTHRAEILRGDAGATAVRVLKAMAHRERLAILCLLMDGEMCVRDLEREVGMRQAALSQQLSRLRTENIVAAQRRGRFMLYRIKTPQVRTVVQALCSELTD